MGLDQHTWMGHEFAGEVVEVGRDVRTLAVGDIVISSLTVNCGHCYYCNVGLTCWCIENQLSVARRRARGCTAGYEVWVKLLKRKKYNQLTARSDLAQSMECFTCRIDIPVLKWCES